MSLKQNHPLYIRRQLNQLTSVMFGKREKGDIEKSLSFTLVSAAQAYLQKYPRLRSYYEAGDVLAKTYKIVERKIMRGQAIIDNLEVIITSDKEGKEYERKNLDFWLRRISWNVVRDLSKKERRLANGLEKLKSYVKSQELHVCQNYSAAGHESFKDSDDLKKASLAEALTRISEEDKDILLLHYIDDLGWEDVGAILDIKTPAARKRGNRALKRLRENFFALYPFTEEGEDS